MPTHYPRGHILAVLYQAYYQSQSLVFPISMMEIIIETAVNCCE
jgi:hypothetical protein